MKHTLDVETISLQDGVTRIEASAGTGKTFAITGLLLRLLLDGRVKDLSQVLIVTFTEAATAELKTRVRRALFDAASVLRGSEPDLGNPLHRLVAARADRSDPAVFERALEHLDRASIFTIHGFCRRLLEQMAFESGAPFSFEMLTDPAELLDRAGRDFWHATVAADDLLSQLAVDQNWTFETFLTLTWLADRFPDTQLRPEAPPLAVAAADFESALKHLRSAWDRGLFRTLAADVVWNKPFDSGFGLREDKREITLGAVDAVCSGRLVGNLVALSVCAPDGLEAKRNKRKEQIPEAFRQLVSSEAARACADVLSALDPLRIALQCDFVKDVRARFLRMREERQVLSFDDLLRTVRDAVRDPQTGRLLRDEVRRQYAVALIDEFQDTDPVQAEIFSNLFSGRTLFYIGDPKQAIYAFRGADLRTYLDAVRRADHHYTLDKNWRSEPALIEAVNEVFRSHPSPFLDPEIRFDPVDAGQADGFAVLTDDAGAPFQFRFIPIRKDGKAWSKRQADEMIGRFVAGEVGRLRGCRIRLGGQERRVLQSDIGILVRTHRQSQSVQRALRRAGIHSVVSKAGNVLATTEAREMTVLMRALLDPRRGDTLRAALSGTLLGYTASEILKLLTEEDAWRRLAEAFRGWQETWMQFGIVRLMARVTREAGVYERLLRLADGERRATNLRHLVEILHTAERLHSLQPDGLLAWFEKSRAEPGDQKELYFLRLESDDEAAKIATVHSAKGLEYPIVFAPYLWDASPPDLNKPLLVHDGGGHTLHLSCPDKTDPAYIAADRDRLAEEMRLTYVALTRARARCYVVWGYMGRDDSKASAAAYLLHGRDLPIDRDVVPAQVADVLSSTARTWRTDLEALADRVPETISVEDLHPAADHGGRAGSSAVTSQEELRCRVLSEDAIPRLRPWEMSSFSALTASAVHAAVDPDADPDLPASPAVEPAGPFAFAKGTSTGLCLHHLFETLDFRDVQIGGPDVREAVRDALKGYGLHEAGAHESPIDPERVALEMLQAVLAHRLPGEGFALADLDRNRRLDEWRFHLPILDRISLADLAPVFERGLTPSLVDAYVPHLRSGSDRRVRGFLTGSADLVFEHEGKWYLVDWKTNHLGYERSDYAPASVVQAMCSHHYILQYHLYLTALDRYLAWRVPGYAYDTHFGGVWYVFLRGAGPDDDGGFFFDRPAAEMIASLGRLLSPAGS